MTEPPAPPSLLLGLTELSRAGVETSRLARQFRGLVRSSPRGNGQPVLALPGYGGADGSMTVLRAFLGLLGYREFALALGRNFESPDDRIKRVEDALAFREKMGIGVRARIEEIHRETGRKVSLVGWSMGGLYAVDAANDAPELVEQVVTLGSPFGDPRGTSMWPVLRFLSRSDVPVEAQDFSGWLSRAKLEADDVPVTVIYSEQDGIVGTGIAKLEGRNVTHVRVRSSHVAFAHNPDAYRCVGVAIAEGVLRARRAAEEPAT